MARKMVLLVRVLWVYLFTFIFSLVGFIGRRLFRLRGKSMAQNGMIQAKQECYTSEFVIEQGEDSEEDELESFLRFRFPTYEEFVQSNDLDGVGDQLAPFDHSECNTSDVLRCKNRVVSEHVGKIVEPEMSSEGNTLVRPVDEPRMSSENIISRREARIEESRRDVTGVHVDVVEENLREMSSEGNMTVEPVDEIVEPRMSSKNIISRREARIEESRRDVTGVHVDRVEGNLTEMGSEGNIIVKPVYEIVEPRMSSENIISRREPKIEDSRRDVTGVHVDSVEENMTVKPVDEIVEPRMSSENIISQREPKIEDSRRDVKGVHVVSVEGDLTEMSSEGNIIMKPVDEIVEPRMSSENTLGSNVRHEGNFHSDDESLVSDSDSDSDSDSKDSSNSSLRSSFIDSPRDGFLSDIDFERAFETDTLMSNHGRKKVKLSTDFSTEEDIELRNLSRAYGSDDLEDVDEDILHELRMLEHDLEDEIDSFDTNEAMNTELELSSRSTSSEERNSVLNFVDVGEDDSKQSSEKSSSGEQVSSDSENGLEREWEHQDLVEQLKMEIKNVRAIGLPTILEDSESPKIMDDLQPWKIDQKYPRQGTADELHKFYRSYRERMRRLDILNFQKMYAVGFLRLKDPLQSFTGNKFSFPALSAIMSFDFWPCKPKIASSVIHPPLMKKFTRELESDLEMVYVGQMCLSWEFLCWEYDKALDLWDSDPRGLRQYNEVAEKFQMFQVVLTRFLEDDSFQGPRVQHYVKNRCVLRNLLQVPVIQDDNYRDRKKERKVISSVDGVTSLQLVEIIEESIRLLWQFIRTDKDSSNPTLVMCRRSSNVELQSPADATLLEEVRSTLQKKDKKLKELSRSDRCVLKKFRKQATDDSDSVLHFFSRVDMKLVSRVLNMSRISRDQLVWCSDKLNKINFVGRQLHVEPSVLFFPCS